MTQIETVPFANLSLQWDQVKIDVMPELEELFKKSAFCLGPWVERFESDIAEYLGVRHGVAVNSGTSALHLAVIAAGLKRGDKVLVPAQTFIGTVWGAIYEGLVPVFCDVDPETATITFEEMQKRMQPGVKGVIPVHLFGQPAHMDSIMSFAHEHNLIVIEDVAQSIGASFGGKALGTIGLMGCFSFYPGKNLGGAGEGGLITTNDKDIAVRLRALRSHGQYERYVHTEIGFNYRMDGIQGLVLGYKLKKLDEWTEQRKQIAIRYINQLADLPIKLPKKNNGDHVWHLFVIRTSHRDKLREYMINERVETGLHYPVPLQRQPCLSGAAPDPEDYPAADEWADNALSLPIFAGMTSEQQDRVIKTVRGFFEK